MLAEIFAPEVLRFIVGRELLSPEYAKRLLSWRHTGFSVHSRVRAKTREEAGSAGLYQQSLYNGERSPYPCTIDFLRPMKTFLWDSMWL